MLLNVSKETDLFQVPPPIPQQRRAPEQSFDHIFMEH